MSRRLYPMPIRYETVIIEVTPDGWSFQRDADRLRFEALPVAKRLDLRREFERQVALAQRDAGLRRTA